MADANKIHRVNETKWAFPWHVMDVLIDGKSIIDLERLNIQDLDEAKLFIKAYGFDIDDAEDSKMLHSLIVESIFFIENILMPKEWRKGNVPPREILQCDDPRYLLLWASDKNPENKKIRDWACALLRIIHTISHINSVYQYKYINEAREQILNRFLKFIDIDENGHYRLGEGSDTINLLRLECKKSKSRQSITLKLLHKKANVAETIHDLIGIRIVTKNLLDALLAVKYLRQYYLITFANVDAARVRNSLVDYKFFKNKARILEEDLQSQRISEKEFEKSLTAIAKPLSVSPTGVNPHSQRNYKSLQLTCRQLVRLRHPALNWLERFNKTLRDEGYKSSFPGSWQKLSDIVKFVKLSPEVKRLDSYSEFFNFEIQIMDEKSYVNNSYGDASHDRYKKSQIRSARRRILRDVLRG